MKMKEMDLESSIIFYPLGWIYLWIRYRNKETIGKILFEKYEGSYSVAGTLVCLKTFGVLFLTSILLMLLAAFYSIIKHGIS
jgi:hypothetical protein